MPVDFQHYWALLAATGLTAAVGLFVVFRVYTDSVRGRLRAEARALRGCYAETDRAARRVRAAEKRLGKLSARRETVRPRRLDEARDALEDARALSKIAADRVLVAETRVRSIIVEEYPPNRQEALRRRYLRPDEGEDKPAPFR